MNLNKMKNFVIITLVIAAVYQTGELWLENVTSHNFFYSLFSDNEPNAGQSSTETIAFMPESVVIGYGNKKYQKFYTGVSFQSFLEDGNAFIRSTIKNGTFQGIVPIDWDLYLRGKSLLYLFDFSVTSSEFMKSIGDLGGSLDVKLKYFDAVAILPARTTAESSKLFFINTESGEAVGYTLDKGKENTALYAKIEEYQQADNHKLFYISARENGFHIFKPRVFLPQWIEEKYEYAAYQRETPFEENGKFSRELLERGIEGFFDNYIPNWNMKDKEAYIYSDENTVVKYFPTGVLEYYNYTSADESHEQTLSSAYAACMQFIKKDKTLSERLYLSHAAMTEEGLTFYFDYTLDQFSVSMSEALREQTGLSHAVEIVVKNNSIRKYRRLACTFLKLDEMDYADIDFSQALDKVIGETQRDIPVTSVENISLSYMLGPEEEILLQWRLEINEAEYFYQTKRQE